MSHSRNSAATIVDKSIQRKRMQSQEDEADEEDDEDDEDEEDDEGYFFVKLTTLSSNQFKFRPMESKGLEEDMKRILEYISRYAPQEYDLNPELKPFIPDLIPTIGDIDAFIKIERPDMAADLVGLALLDEPAAVQSDPSGILFYTLSALL